MKEKDSNFVIGVDNSNGIDYSVLSVDLIVNYGRGNTKSFLLVQKTISELAENYIIVTKQLNPKITHLAYHAKKARVRKKNKTRLYRFACQLAGISSKEA